MRNPMLMRIAAGVGVMAVVVIVDQLTKVLAAQWGWLVFNPGISFGWVSGSETQIVTAVLIFWVLVIIMFEAARNTTLSRWGWWLMAGGGVANMLDRLQFQAVRDWLPIPGLALKNNLADWAIFGGVVWLLGAGFLGRTTNQKQEADGHSL